MPLSHAAQQDRLRAAVLGFAVGDALGFPLRGVPPEALARLPLLAEDFAPRPRGRFAKGQFSDDTQLMLAVAESAALEGRIDGRSAAAHLASLWQEGVLLQPPASVAEAAERLRQGMPWMSAGAPIGVRDPSALSRGLVVGAWNAQRPERIAHEASVVTVISHKDPFCAAGVAAYARAVALGVAGEALGPQRICELVAAAAAPHSPELAAELKHLPRTLAWEEPRAFAQLRRVAVPASLLKGAQGLPAHVAPALLVALYAWLRAPHDFRGAVARVLRCGGEADVSAALCGGLLAAHGGTEAIPPRLRKHVLYAEQLVETADRLFSAQRWRSVAQVAVGRVPRER